MNLIKILLATLFFVLAMLLAVQNVDVLSRPMAFGLDWPTSLAVAQELPLYAVIIVFFLVGFGLASLFALRGHLGRRRQLQDVKNKIKALERKLQPESAAAVPASFEARQGSQTHLQTETEQTMDSSAATPIAESLATQVRAGDEILARPSAPGWGAVLLLAAVLALVFSGGVYIVLNERLAQFTAQIDEIYGRTGHLSSVQEEMRRSWEQKGAVLREEIGALSQTNAALLKEVGSLEEQVQALVRLPEEVRKRLVAGFLRDTAGRAVFLGSQVDGEKQREALQGIHERLQTLALELEGGAAKGNDSE